MGPTTTPEAVSLDRVHLVGIGGAGMSGLARILLARGSEVSGSDQKESTAVQVLRTLGAQIAVGHAAENLDLSGQAPTVVVTSFAAIPQDNPELVAARDADIPIIRRSDLLGELMEGYTQVLLAGTHGKTSTTSMAVSALQHAGEDPSFAIGGQLNRAGTNAHHGTGRAFVAEADESDASLLRYRPDVAVVTNIEPDHLDFFSTPEAYFQVFEDFVDRISPTGHLVVCLEDEHAAQLGQRARQGGINVVGYGTPAAVERFPDLPAAAVISQEEATAEGTCVSVHLDSAGHSVDLDYLLQMPGHHMVLNSAAALVAGTLTGADPSKLADGLSDFTGVRRRFEYRGAVPAGPGGTQPVEVFDDYAHHPSEVAAVLRAARQRVQATTGSGRVVVCFQPHLYSRTMQFQQEFADALSLADVAVVLDIYGAREQPVEGISSRIITDKIPAGTEVYYEPDFSAAAASVAAAVQPGDLVLTMGAGSVTLAAAEILVELKKHVR